MITGNPLEKQSWAKLRNQFWQAVRRNPTIFITTWIREMIKTYLGLFSTNIKVLVEPETKGGDVSFSYTRGSIATRIQQYITAGTTKPILKLVGFLEFAFNILKYLLSVLALLWLLTTGGFNPLTRECFLAGFFSCYLCYFALVTGFDGCSRYRTMFEFVLLLLAAVGIYLCVNTPSSKGDPSRLPQDERPGGTLDEPNA